MLTAYNHIVSPLTAPWCGWTMLVLFLLAVLSEWIQRGVITQTLTSLTVHSERTYKDAPTNTLAQLFITLFRFGTFAMAICLCFASEGFSFAAYAAVLGIILGVMLLKMLCNRLLDYTFQITRLFGDANEHYANILTLASVVMYVLLLIFLRIDSEPAYRWMVGSVAALFFLLWLYRSARQFVRSPMAVLYLLLYMATLELLPMAGITVLSAKTIAII